MSAVDRRHPHRKPASPDHRARLSEAARLNADKRRGFSIPPHRSAEWRHLYTKLIANKMRHGTAISPRQLGQMMGLCSLLLLFVVPALAHQAPSGWQYPYACCSRQDCRPLKTGEVVYTPGGWNFPATGQTFPEAVAQPSPDKQSHACFVHTMEGLRVRNMGSQPCFWIGEGQY